MVAGVLGSQRGYRGRSGPFFGNSRHHSRQGCPGVSVVLLCLQPCPGGMGSSPGWGLGASLRGSPPSFNPGTLRTRFHVCYMVLSLFSPWLWLTFLVSVLYHPHFWTLKNSSESHLSADIFLDATESIDQKCLPLFGRSKHVYSLSIAQCLDTQQFL